jgi:hypothetical protein
VPVVEIASAPTSIEPNPEVIEPAFKAPVPKILEKVPVARSALAIVPSRILAEVMTPLSIVQTEPDEETVISP